MGKYENAAKCESKSPAKGSPVLKPRGVARSNRSMKTLNDHLKIQKYAQGIFHNGATVGHIAVLATGAQQSIVGMGGCEIIKRHNTL